MGIAFIIRYTDGFNTYKMETNIPIDVIQKVFV